ncbi:MAG: UDP-N-acetylmuramoyl-tripeptide--D-alanyl-D-alanine ligase [Dehalococcoidia bacterium]|nr:UDP-N-acetylmuramoyl-tripeptide--D-alanyl-D-alanine ligase [Dehalococcoidia bacterium]
MMTAEPVLDSAFVEAALGDRLRRRLGPDARFERAVIDSRQTRPGDLFVALPGEQTDGHQHAAAAVAAGATGCLLARDVDGVDAVARFIVDDPLAALQHLGAAWRDRLTGLEVVGVTGNVGKTTTKLLTAAVLRARYRVQASEQNYNNEIGVPLCLLELRPETQRAVIEMGMYTTGEIALFCEWARPRIGIVLNVGPVHLERAGSIENIARAKRELVEALPSDGHAVLNADDPYVRDMVGATEARVWLFGEAGRADVRGDTPVSHGRGGFEFTLSAPGASRRVHVPLPGAHLMSNVLAAATAGLADGLTFEEVADAIEALDVPSRLRILELPGDITLLDDSYNANPASMLAALDLLVEIPGRHVALLGDMLELGSEAEPAHERVGHRAAQVLDVLFTVGDLGRRISETAFADGLAGVRHLGSTDEAFEAVSAVLQPGDALLVKGSHALALDTVVERLVRAAGGGAS